MERIKSAILYIVFCALCLIMAGCDGAGKDTTQIQENGTYKQGEKQCILNIDYRPNLFFAKDNLDIYIDGTKVYTIANGEEKMYSFSLTKGSHSLKLSSGMFHSKSINFQINDNGDSFAFVAKNHTNKLELWLSESCNYYTAMGEEIPADNAVEQQVIKGESIKQSTDKGIWSKVWSFIKVVFIFVGIIVVFACVGMLIYEVFKAVNLINQGLIVIFIALIALGIIFGFNVIVLILGGLYLLANIIFSSKKKNVPKKYKHFKVIIEAEKNSYVFLYSYICPVVVLAMPELLENLPFTIHNINLYMYFYVAVVLAMAITGVESEVNFLSELSEYINKKGKIGIQELEEYLEVHMKSDSTEDDRQKYADKLKMCLDDFVKIGEIEENEKDECYYKI